MAEPLKGTESAANALARVKYSHDAMIDLVIANPRISQNEIAGYFGYTVPWVSRIFGSDAFQARLAERKAELVNPALTEAVEGRLKGLAMQSLDILEEKLQATRSADMAMKALEISTKAAGYGARQQNVAVQNNFVVALPPKSADAQSWAQAHRPEARVVEAETVEVLPAGGSNA